MKQIIVLSLCLVVATFSNDSEGSSFDPSNYDECILEHMKGVTSDEAAKKIKRSCRNKFAKKSKSIKTRPLTHQELTKISGRAGIDEKSDLDKIFDAGPKQSISGYIVNQNDDVTVPYISLEISPKVEGEQSTQSHEVYVNVPPQGTDQFFLTVLGDDHTSFSWDIVGATGY